jgi:hypothetical protein
MIIKPLKFMRYQDRLWKEREMRAELAHEDRCWRNQQIMKEIHRRRTQVLLDKIQRRNQNV